MLTTKVATAPSNTMSPSAALFAASKAKHLSDFSKPYKNEAVLRLRNTTMSLLALILLTHLLPVPSLWTAFNVVRGGSDVGAVWAVCAAELSLSGLLGLNLIQAAVAIRYPRSPLPPPFTPPAKGITTPQGQKKRRTILSPGTSPQAQRSFTPSYVPSPASTPSRTLHYSMPSTPSPFGVSLGSSASMPSTPSPSLAAYHGRHPPSLGQPFNASTLSRLTGDSDEEQ
ncbi:hypothetical protein PAXRUDRAFT_378968 [Paxillus rubicundulus Ve08.2h10]|uniref:Uncharacterized protein n=1 Tax=Paxillus rubicundulus Ve08.2h10 TaxID=930991 RepID=A0A0D0DDT9_9AGAM|nr:hypothetical protein PAXRUDRAFT_378968 [Paxillus rubicundulus Ve08.2h10]